jgi:hypothetical protein
MKTLSLRLNESIFLETEKVVSIIHKPRNKYLNEAIDYYNRIQKQALIAKKLEHESKLVKSESMKVLKEFERLHDNTKAI